MKKNLRIAQIAPPWIAIPPKQYGGAENVIYHLVEEQVAQGHDVTLIAPGDAKTSAKLVSFYPKSLLESVVPWTMHLKAFYHLQKAVDYIKEQRFDIVHTCIFKLRYVSFPSHSSSWNASRYYLAQYLSLRSRRS